MFDKYYVLDTNILLEDATNIYKLSQDGKNLIILAETVLDEIDTKKSGFDEINFQAREFARILEDSNIISSTKKDLYKIIRLKINNKDTVIDIISKDEYEINSKNVSLNIINDRKILEISTFANTYYKHKVEFISLDIMVSGRKQFGHLTHSHLAS
ncbi:PIN domain-containing protein [Aliarcobacter butzleri]|uniref:PIN domain-containing protein n=1 Tax=Aliarcobacter butzleri TaxID=28197 RepID=UPI0021B52DAA|nr:PIN domain-containing protein [Aliarcobacter butzleri]MCT7606957.1 PIN domain-containing protein [Aliarcobacter butzleri]